jgi:phospholipid/cholesterol/gamma-HCH transport system ATP-binding protein
MGVPPQIQPSPGLPERRAVKRRHERVLAMLHTLPPNAQDAVRQLLDQEDREEREAREEQPDTSYAPSSSQYELRDDDTQNLRLGQY